MGIAHIALCPFYGVGGGQPSGHHLLLWFLDGHWPVPMEYRSVCRFGETKNPWGIHPVPKGLSKKYQ